MELVVFSDYVTPNAALADGSLDANAFQHKPFLDQLFHEEKDSPYVNLVVARQDNKDRKEILDFVKAYQTDEVYAKARELFQEGVVKGW